MRKQFDIGLRKAERLLAQDPDDLVANSFRLMCLHELDREEEIAQILEAQPSLANDPECQYTLAYIASDQGNFDEAEHYLRRHNAVSNDRADVWELLGQTIVIPATAGA